MLCKVVISPIRTAFVKWNIVCVRLVLSSEGNDAHGNYSLVMHMNALAFKIAQWLPF